MYDAINTLASRERERQRIAVLVEQHVGGQIIVMRDGKRRGATLLERCLP